MGSFCPRRRRGRCRSWCLPSWCQPRRRIRCLPAPFAALLLALLLAPTLPAHAAQETPPADDLTELSLEELMDVEVTSVSKRAETISEAAAAVFVLSQEDIRRSGATTIPEALRLVPGVQVARSTSSVWAISARGFNGRFANKLLVLIDGRSVYTPLFSGVYWDVQDTLLADVERIEVIRGPGAALWGANAVNGVINILTKPAAATQGLLLTAGAGSELDGAGGVRYGGRSGSAAWRVYAKRADRDAGAAADGSPGADDWSVNRGGFRLDAAAGEQGGLTLQGDVYDGRADERIDLGGPFANDAQLSGGNLLARWKRSLGDSSELSLQVYYDRTERVQSTLDESRHTYDVDFQHSFTSGRQEVVWGLGYRRTRDELVGSDTLSFVPDERRDELYSAFVQDEIAVVPGRFWVTLGAKLEENDYTGFEVQPSLRALWLPRPRHTLWAAVSRAVRTPSRAEADVVLFSAPLPPGALFPGSPPALPVILGSDDFDSEELIAYEAGYRVGFASGVFLDVALFLNDYDHLRDATTLAPVPVPGPQGVVLTLPTVIDNRMRGETYGLEIAADWWATDRWHLAAAYSLLEIDLTVRGEGATGSTAGIEGSNPQQQLILRSSWQLAADWQADLVGRWVDALPAQGIDDYLEADLRLGWQPRDGFELALVGRNLLDDQHFEFVPEIIPTLPTAVERSVHLTLTWGF